MGLSRLERRYQAQRQGDEQANTDEERNAAAARSAATRGCPHFDLTSVWYLSAVREDRDTVSREKVNVLLQYN